MRRSTVRTMVMIMGVVLLAIGATPQPPVETRRVIIRLADPVGARSSLMVAVRRPEVTLDERHRMTIEGLRSLHGTSLARARPVLFEAQTAGRLVELDRLWIVNAVVAEVDAAWIERIESDPAVAEIIEDRRLTLDGASTAAASALQSMPEAALVQIRAPEVWAQGITGLGAIVANVDSGVNGDDDTLTEDWRGRFAGSDATWFAPVSLTVFPEDDFSISNGHGTATMGIMVGGEETFGVAFDATWIAADAFEGGEGFISNVLKIYEWLSDPDGDPSTRSDVPDVVNNSFGITVPGAQVCDTIFDDAIDAVEAAGAIVIWSAGNQGQNGITAPASRADTPVNAFSVGSVDAQNVVVSSSGRGPSACGGPNATKPEIVAPGDRVRSRNLFNGFQTVSGTSFATPMVGGVLALMRSKNPDITPERAKTILLETATDLVVAGDDNDSGSGLVNALAAINAVDRPTQPRARLVGLSDAAGATSKLDFAGIEDALVLRPGGSASLVPVLTNHGPAIPASTATLTSVTPGVSISRGTVPLAAAATGARIPVADGSSFGVTIGSGVPAGVDLVFDVTVQGAAIGPFRLILKAGDPIAGTFATHDRGQVRLTVTNFGGLGFYTGIHESGFVLRGDGFRFPATSDNWLFHAGLMAGVGPTRLSDDIPYGEDTQNSTDWFPLPGAPIVTDEVAGGQRITAKYDDRHAIAPLGLRVTQESFAFPDPGEDAFVIVQFQMENASQQTLGGLRLGLFVDWDLPDSGGDPAETVTWQPGLRLGITEGADASLPSLGVVALTDVPLAQVSFAALPRSEIVVNGEGSPILVPAEAPDIAQGEFSDAEKWNALASGQSNTTVTPAQDAYQIIGIGPVTLGAGAIDTFAVALVGAPGRTALEAAADQARNTYFNRVLGVEPPPPPPPPSAVALGQNFPNPFRSGEPTTIPFAIAPESGNGVARAQLVVFDLLGQRVRTLIDGDAVAGEQATTWDGTADSGALVPSGVYIVRLVANGAERVIRVLVVR